MKGTIVFSNGYCGMEKSPVSRKYIRMYAMNDDGWSEWRLAFLRNDTPESSSFT